MSVRDFSNQPCGVCKSDTLHYKMQCKTCGNVKMHPYDAFAKRTEALIKKGHLIGESVQVTIGKQKNQIARARSEYLRRTGQRAIDMKGYS